MKDNFESTMQYAPTSSKPSDLRITDVRFTDLKDAPMHCILVKIYTNQGITGVGEIRDNGSRTYGEMLKSRLVGENPCNVDRIFRRIKQFAGPARQAGGVSGIEIALWDLAGKAYGVPVYALLGGKFRDSIRMYCDLGRFPRGKQDGHGMGLELKRHVDEAGFTMVKAVLGVEKVQALHPNETVISYPAGILEDLSRAGSVAFRDMTGASSNIEDPYLRCVTRNEASYQNSMEHPFTMYRMTERGLDLFEEEVAAMRDVLGYKIPLAIDHPGRIGLEDAMRLCRRLEKYNLSWLEDLFPPYYVEEYKRLSQVSGTPLATGEDAFGVEGFEKLCQERAVALVHPDICSAGGIMEMKNIGNVAQRYNVGMIAHMCETPIAALATAHMGVATQNFIACEFNAPDDAWWDQMISGFGGPVIQNGFITPNEKPGLGFDDLNDEVLREHLFDGFKELWASTERWDAEFSNDRLFS